MLPQVDACGTQIDAAAALPCVTTSSTDAEVMNNVNTNATRTFVYDNVMR
jgi:hypothetical protein